MWPAYRSVCDELRDVQCLVVEENDRISAHIGKYMSLSDIPENSRLTVEHAGPWLLEQLKNNEGANGTEEKNFEVISEKLRGLKEVAEELGCTMAQLALAWVCVIVLSFSLVVLYCFAVLLLFTPY